MNNHGRLFLSGFVGLVLMLTAYPPKPTPLEHIDDIGWFKLWGGVFVLGAFFYSSIQTIEDLIVNILRRSRKDTDNEEKSNE